MTVGNAESKFLESQKARTDHLRQNAKRNRKEDALNTFWSSLKSYLSSWDNRLEQLSEAHAVAATTEEEKRTVHLEICELQEELKQLRKGCLSTSYQTLDQNDATAKQLPTPPDELPLTDIRLLHNEFTNSQAKLDQVRQKVLPRGKFVFRRYREALRKQEQGEIKTVSAASKEFTSNSSSKPSMTKTHDENELSDIRHQVVDVYADGRVKSSPKDNKRESNEVHRKEVPSVLRNVDNSTVCM